MKVRQTTAVYQGIRAAIRAGENTKKIAERFGVRVGVVYDQRFRLRKNKRAAVKAKVLARGKKMFTKKEVSQIMTKLKEAPELPFLREELASVERQIDSLNTIASFLAIRVRQLEQNGA